MPQTKESTVAKVNTEALGWFLTLTSAAILLPFFIHLQWLTGPLVNAAFILILFLAGRKYAYLACLIPSLMALAGGLLPAVLAPVIPFIMIGNVIYVATIDLIYNKIADSDKSYALAVLSGALLKYVFLQSSLILIAKFLIKKSLILAVAQMISWPQFATAVIGGMIAWIFLKWLKRF